MSCNNACQLWLTGAKNSTEQPQPQPQPPPPPPQLLFDERYDRHVEHFWDATAAKQVSVRGKAPTFAPMHLSHSHADCIRTCTRAHAQVVRRVLSNRSGWGRLPLGRPGQPPPRISALGPLHIMATFTGAAAAGLDPAALLARFRRKLRLSGAAFVCVWVDGWVGVVNTSPN